MKLIIAEKNDAARQIAERLSTGKPKKDKVYNTAIYRFEWKGEECVTIGLAGHILAPDFCDSVLFDKKLGWYSVTEDGEMLPADMPDGLARPPYDTKRKPFLADGISIKVEVGDRLHVFNSEIVVGSSLIDAKEQLAGINSIRKCVETRHFRLAAFQPAGRTGNRSLGVFIFRRVGDALVKGHRDCRAEI